MSNSYLYHYTSVEGFKNIIESHSLSLTESNFLNDPQDCKLFEYILKNNIKDNENKTAQEIIDSCKLKENKDEILKVISNCSFEDYIDYLYKHIKLYVMSFSKDGDDLSMWNYYGKGGLSLKISKNELINEIKKLLKDENEYFIFEEVIYSNNDTIDKVPNFDSIELYSKDEDYVLKSNIENEAKNEDAKYLLDNNELKKFYYIFYKSYLFSINYVLSKDVISFDSNQESICKAVFNSILELPESMLWKRNLSIYMILLTALIKSNSYESEKEVRIVYFKHSIDDECNDKNIDFFVKHTPSGDLLSPCIYLKEDINGFKDTLKELIISPVSKNLTIGQDVYKDTLIRYLLHNGYKNKKVKYSKHSIRW